ncbi:hypothetical protein [Aliamphritea ceti]|uniref:hypothetical protein n=1 Tax=Aliamphritea ceti TaxID=1524258 RepID=UPI0021C39CE9|nr:hypothetical protein [Aliamphritea ceti]
MSWLIPEKKRNIPGKRWLSIGLRTLHLIGIAGLSGAFLFDLPKEVWHHYLLLTLASGGLMVLKELYSDGIWLIQLRGQIIMLKVVLLALAWFYWEAYDLWLYMLSIVLSGIISHGPGKLRYYSLWHGKVFTRDVMRGRPLGKVKDSGESE